MPGLFSLRNPTYGFSHSVMGLLAEPISFNQSGITLLCSREVYLADNRGEWRRVQGAQIQTATLDRRPLHCARLGHMSVSGDRSKARDLVSVISHTAPSLNFLGLPLKRTILLKTPTHRGPIRIHVGIWRRQSVQLVNLVGLASVRTVVNLVCELLNLCECLFVWDWNRHNRDVWPNK